MIERTPESPFSHERSMWGAEFYSNRWGDDSGRSKEIEHIFGSRREANEALQAAKESWNVLLRETLPRSFAEFKEQAKQQMGGAKWNTPTDPTLSPAEKKARNILLQQRIALAEALAQWCQDVIKNTGVYVLADFQAGDFTNFRFCVFTSNKKIDGITVADWQGPFIARPLIKSSGKIDYLKQTKKVNFLKSDETKQGYIREIEILLQTEDEATLKEKLADIRADWLNDISQDVEQFFERYNGLVVVGSRSNSSIWIWSNFRFAFLKSNGMPIEDTTDIIWGHRFVDRKELTDTIILNGRYI